MTQKEWKVLVKRLDAIEQAILELDAAFRSAGLSADGGVGSLPSPSEDLSPAEPSAGASSTISA